MAFYSNGGYSGDERESRSGDDHPDSDLSDKPIYLLEHLATFTVNKETGIVYPADGMRRLLQLEKTTGIWSQKMQLCLDNQWVLIMDYETGNIIERFPASLIQEPTAFTSNDPMEMYNNILVFIVAGGSGARSEMHIFQCQSISAVHLVEDLKQLRIGKAVIQHRETIPPSSMKSSRDQYNIPSSAGTGGAGSVVYHHETESELGGINDETSSISSDKYERDVTVLNHCFDDIEKFIARLQHAAAASRELERRRRNRKSKKRDPGEGLLTLRTRPPHEKDFIDIFAKFKLSFNLLAKLKSHIHDPNAPELVHFLFTPLALIVEAANDTYFESHLPPRVINPLLTREAVNLLINCVTSKETELWRSLGDAWTIPRDQWKGHTGSYHPVFFDGWSPDYPVVDELEHPATPTNSKRKLETSHHHNVSSGTFTANGGGSGTGVDYDYDGSVSPNESLKCGTSGATVAATSGVHHHHHHGGNNGATERNVDTIVSGTPGGGGGTNTFRGDFSTRSDISIDSIERNGNSGTVTGPTNSSTVGQVPNSSNLNTSAVIGGTTVAGLHLLGNNNVSSQSQDQSIEAWLSDLQARRAKIVQVTYPRTANNDKELTVVRGEYLEVLDDSRKWWKARNRRGQIAHVPHTIVTPYNYAENDDVFNNPLYTQNYSSKNNYSGRQAENMTGSPTIFNNQILNSTEWVRNKHIGSSNKNNNNSQPKDQSLGKQRSQPMGDGQKQLSQQQWKQSIDNNILIANGTFLQHHQKNHQNHHKNDDENENVANSSSTIIPPPPPPPPTTVSAPSQAPNKSILRNTSTNSSTSKSRNSNISQQGNGSDPQNDVNEELKHVLTIFREKRRNLDVMKTPDIYIQQSSTPYEVDKWLKAKGFSNGVLKKLDGLNGNELFALKRSTIEEYCGVEEGKRLFSQITIQRNVSGYTTARTSELQAILAKARQKTEGEIIAGA